MAINFPNAPTNGQTYTEGSTQWQYDSANNTWTLITFGNAGIENATNYNNTIVNLTRTGSQNIQSAADGLTFNDVDKTLGIKAKPAQIENLFEMKDSSDIFLNGFNLRGILEKAGRIYYSSSAPTVNSADTGQLWYNPDDNGIRVLKTGGVWSIAGTGVTLDTNQEITGAKTFTEAISLKSANAKIQGQGVSKSIIFAPTNATGAGVPVTALELSTSAATFSVPVQLSAVGATTKTVLLTLGDDQTISSLKTFGENIKLSSGTGTSRIYCDESTNGSLLGIATDAIVIQPNQSTTGRFIKVFPNTDNLETNGITIRPKNTDNIGKLNVDGSMTVSGSLNVTGTITTSAGLVAAGVTYGSLSGSVSPNTGGNKDYAPSALGFLTFALDVASPTYSDHGILVTNTSTTQTIKLFVRREHVLAGAPYFTYGMRLITMGPSSQFKQKAGDGAPQVISGTVTNEVVSSTPTTINLIGSANPCTFTFSLGA